ncbi:MAG: cob(I)yrinic acid a,c-diamide adenosyltransferase [Mariniblastus sp.]
MKIYTKTGDQGETGLLGGVRVSKSHSAIKVCGSVDEVNSFIGLSRVENQSISLNALLTQIQHDLFDLGSRVAACLSSSDRIPDFPPERVAELERAIDQYDEELAPLKAFILPGGGRTGGTLHLARSVCRRAERQLVELINSETKTDLSLELIYLNRLGDLLFVLARYTNQLDRCPETEWNVGRQDKS